MSGGGRRPLVRSWWQIVVLAVPLVWVWWRTDKTATMAWVDRTLGDEPVLLGVAAWSAMGLPLLAWGLAGMNRRRSGGELRVIPFVIPREHPEAMVLLERVLLAVSLVPYTVAGPRRGGSYLEPVDAAFVAAYVIGCLGTLLVLAGGLGYLQLRAASGRANLPGFLAAGSVVLLVLCVGVTVLA